MDTINRQRQKNAKSSGKGEEQSISPRKALRVPAGTMMAAFVGRHFSQQDPRLI